MGHIWCRGQGSIGVLPIRSCTVFIYESSGHDIELLKPLPCFFLRLFKSKPFYHWHTCHKLIPYDSIWWLVVHFVKKIASPNTWAIAALSSIFLVSISMEGEQVNNLYIYFCLLPSHRHLQLLSFSDVDNYVTQVLGVVSIVWILKSEIVSLYKHTQVLFIGFLSMESY